MFLNGVMVHDRITFFILRIQESSQTNQRTRREERYVQRRNGLNATNTYMKLRKYICTFSITYHKYDIAASVITDTIINYVYEDTMGLTESD